jgi:predicted AlkP superfamily phosphohydrolase/phosphomutase
MGRVERVLVIGLDCAAPRFVFGPDAFDLPNLRALMQRGAYGPLRSCDPPITIPAWACMTTGFDPGQLGVYGFQYRRDHGYFSDAISTSQQIAAPRVWDRLGDAGKRVAIVGVPQTYPVKPVNGVLVSGFLTPDTSVQFTHPPELGRELLDAVGDYVIDAIPYRTGDKAGLLERLHALLDNRFAIARYIMDRVPWDFFMMVEIGLDRLHHGFWRYCDPQHPRYERHPTLSRAFEDYYQKLDAHIGTLLERISENTAVMVVSDHGARAMHGGVYLNEWLAERGWLALTTPLTQPTPLRACPVDWSRTRAYAFGGYCARVHLNVRGREPQGIVAPSEYEATLDRLTLQLEAMSGPGGRRLGNRVVRPGETYRAVNGIAPDLLVYLGGLDWRALGDLGAGAIFTTENNSGPDDANHDFDGILILDDRSGRNGEALRGASLYDITPTILDYFGLPPDSKMRGKSLACTTPPVARSSE